MVNGVTDGSRSAREMGSKRSSYVTPSIVKDTLVQNWKQQLIVWTTPFIAMGRIVNICYYETKVFSEATFKRHCWQPSLVVDIIWKLEISNKSHSCFIFNFGFAQSIILEILITA